jgi:hypothetical protein
MSKPISPPPATTASQAELPAYVSNGVIGLRVLDIPLLPGIVLVSGLAGSHPELEIEAAARAPYPVAGDLSLNGLWLTRAPQQVEFTEQRYDFSAGELTTRFRFHEAAVDADVEVLTFCSRAQPTIVLQEISVEVSAACDLVLRSIADTTDVKGRLVRRETAIPGPAGETVDGSLLWETLGARAECGVATATEFLGDEEALRTRREKGLDSPLMTDYRLNARPGRTYRLRQLASVVPTVLHHDPDRAAIRLVARARAFGFEELRAENRARWDELWKGRVLITADDQRWQALADAAFYYLNSSVHPSSPASTSIYGLAQWHDYHYYYGHVMWDIEIFALPPLLVSQPDAAEAMLEYRFRSIPAARSNAELHGRRGLQFPWRSSPLHGEESSPGPDPASWFEDHISLDIAWAYAQLAHATGDERIKSERVAPIVYGVADWLTSRVTPSRRGYEIRRVMGIAERRVPSDNDAYTIMAAKLVLREALEVARQLGVQAPRAWSAADEGLKVRVSPRSGAIMTHDGYQPGEEKGATPSPLAGLFPLWYPSDDKTTRATLEYFLALAPDYIGSPMLSALYGVWAAWAGDRRLAAELFDSGYASFVTGRFLQTLEHLPSKYPDKARSGPFFANIGGFLAGLIYGLPGIRINGNEPQTWPCRPVVLPWGWRSIEVERLWIRGQAARLTAEHGDKRSRLEL